MSCNWLLRAEKIHNMSLPEHNYICLVHKGNQREKDVKMSACHISSPVVGALPWVFLGAHRDFSTLGQLLEWNAESCCFPCTGELLFLVLFPSLDFPFTYSASPRLSLPGKVIVLRVLPLILAVLQKLSDPSFTIWSMAVDTQGDEKRDTESIF